MKANRQLVTKNWRSSFFIIFLILISISNALPQEPSQDPTPEKSEAKKGTTEQASKSKVGLWLQKHPLIARIWKIIPPIAAFIFAWILKDSIKRIITDGLKPLLGRLMIRFFILSGRYNSLLKRYKQAIQRKFRKGDLARRTIGEGVDLESNYIQIQLSKDEYENPEHIFLDSSTGQRQEV